VVGCSRELLQGTLDAYFKALAAHDSSTLPLASSVKFTENGKALELGKDGLWKTAGMVKYSQSALDTETCNSASHAVVPDGSMDIPFALRIKLENRRGIHRVPRAHGHAHVQDVRRSDLCRACDLGDGQRGLGLTRCLLPSSGMSDCCAGRVPICSTSARSRRTDGVSIRPSGTLRLRLVERRR
jgi:hypothetical protein